jgi:hypothetical protein
MDALDTAIHRYQTIKADFTEAADPGPANGIAHKTPRNVVNG